MEHPELAAWLRLSLTPGVGNTSARKLLAAFGLPAALFTQPESALASVVSSNQAAALLQEPPECAALVETTWAWLQAAPESRRVLALGDPLYPQSLLNTEDPPLLLYGMGMPEAWSGNLLNAGGTHCLALVGSRNPSPQGAANAHQFAQALAGAGLTIVSGLALGVDGAAHEGALAGATAGAAAQAVSYTIEPTHTFVHWEARHFGVSTSRGRFDRTSGHISYDAKAKRGQAEVVIDLRSISTGVAPGLPVTS